MSKSYIIKNKWSDASLKERELAAHENKYFICKVNCPENIILRYGVFDPNLNDLVQIIAKFRDIEDAKIFVNALTDID